jgi:YfiH family protein
VLLNFSNDVSYYTFSSLSAFPELIHAVSTRHGGVSQPLTRESLVSPRQVHSAEVRHVGAGDSGRFIPDCDALITSEPGVPLLLRFADCVPILLYDPRRKAIGLAHAGWRGTVAGMAQAAVQAMVEALGSAPDDLVAALGPAIGPCCYEVGPDVTTAVEAAFGPDNGLLRAPVRSAEKRKSSSLSSPSALPQTSRPESLHFDLWSANERQLRNAGVQQIEVAGICTACHRDEFYSYRAENGRTGHHGALVCLREP